MNRFVFAAKQSDLQTRGCITTQVDDHTVALFAYGAHIYAIDNRCPHMGFPLHEGSVKDGILTCHWHHARFDLTSGGTFDLFADDVRAFPVELRGDEIWIDVALHGDTRAHQEQRLHDGLERNIPLVIAKAVIGLHQTSTEHDTDAFRIGLEFGTRYRQQGWGQGLTMLTCLMNLMPTLAPDDRARAMYHGLSAVARDCDNMPPRFTPAARASGKASASRFLRFIVRLLGVFRGSDSDATRRPRIGARKIGSVPMRAKYCGPGS